MDLYMYLYICILCYMLDMLYVILYLYIYTQMNHTCARLLQCCVFIIILPSITIPILVGCIYLESTADNLTYFRILFTGLVDAM